MSEPTNDPTQSPIPINVQSSQRPLGRSGWLVAFEVTRMLAIPAFVLGAFATGIFLLGVAQKTGWLEEPESTADSASAATTAEEVSWICPMMCVPPSSKPGRCPVCGMELVPASSQATSGPSSSIEIDSRARRVAGIETTVATKERLVREIQSVGQIAFDETRQKTMAVYIDGRIESMQADFTGVVVEKGQALAEIYSPDLYAAQVEYVRTLQFDRQSTSTSDRVRKSNQQLKDSSRQKLQELGMTQEQIQTLENSLTPQRTLQIHAPISGTVVEKLATTGQYVKQGTPIYRLADLQSVWLLLQLFPEDAAAIQLGQAVTATTQSTAAIEVTGAVEFVSPTVDPKTRTVAVRVAMANPDGKLKPGEFAQATLTVPVKPEFTADDAADGPTDDEVVVIPRSSLLSVGRTNLAYVESDPGHFHLRHLKIGPTVSGKVAVFEGIQAGENVVSRSAFLVDAQMQLQGNPSLIDPDKAVATKPELSEAQLEEIRLALAPLSDADRKLAEAQEICPVTEVHLGSMGMGTPIKMTVQDQVVFICCEGCRDSWLNEPDKYFGILRDYHSGIEKQTANRDQANESDTGNDLPQMDLPQMELPQMQLPQTEANETEATELPQMELPQMELPQMELPQMELPQMAPPKSEESQQ